MVAVPGEIALRCNKYFVADPLELIPHRLCAFVVVVFLFSAFVFFFLRGFDWWIGRGAPAIFGFFIIRLVVFVLFGL